MLGVFRYYIWISGFALFSACLRGVKKLIFGPVERKRASLIIRVTSSIFLSSFLWRRKRSGRLC